jgi:hypothetical protein
MEALNDISVLSWNIRRTHNNNSRRHLKEVIRKYCPTFLAILETHVPYARLSSFWTNNGYTQIHVIEVHALQHFCHTTTSKTVAKPQKTVALG